MSHLKRKEKLAPLLCALCLAAAAVALIAANQLQVRQTDTQMQSNITASSGSSQASTPEDGEKILEACDLELSPGPTGHEIIAEITDTGGETTRLVLALRSGKGALE